MPEVHIRAFRRDDREQLTRLVNAHIAAVIPGVSVSVNTVLTQLEREPDEQLQDPWVIGRRTIVASTRDAVVAGAHLLRYAADKRVSPRYRDAAEIEWLVCRHRETDAGDALAAACLKIMDGWQASQQYADGGLPAFATYGVPECWPHIRGMYLRAGFQPGEQTEVVLVAYVDQLPDATPPVIAGASVRRSVGESGTRLTATANGVDIAVLEVETDKTWGGTQSRFAGWADVGSLWVRPEFRRQRVGTWLVGQAAGWLRLGRVERLIAYVHPEEDGELAFLTGLGFTELTRTQRGWHRQRPPG